MAREAVKPSRPPRVLVIAGSDSSGGAGIQADIKTVTMLGGYAMTAITAVTAQNSIGVQGVEMLSAEFVTQQINSCLDDIGADAIKIGMLGSHEVAAAVANRLESWSGAIIFDPVMVATSGAALADAETIEGFARLMELCTLVTPNLPELAALIGQPVDSAESIYEAAALLAKRHDCHVLAKGGHSGDAASGDRVIDRLVAPVGSVRSFDHHRIDTRHTHGTGCTLSSAIAVLLGHGQRLDHAVRLARQFTLAALENAPGFGAGNGPMGHQAVRTGPSAGQGFNS
ncbi:bifunctional hydroxymethylpyrimidine kinase/phosphomethylpyrimidine kinase [Altererythrobacter sp. SALINAS58]|uniref:bifunctional hydroxymethylpyrimidine kinase/phosphomethylpyrimidine kinase n=1 Tax=Alteripontixanthobacter muriae TaxID=2705546 RepID=UPI0015758A96|nr:bifunctional hydroxymethylpyrimidine kinase/phosphomethylpyrimidine kinase [Alteripontixanthobacter muriae]NTZ42914.1 bifunctional hydroxymethylpyrimidine kinase/phosphomethylpyrimidine kinase [Alteripontixanthobacter muriae]